ncbi:MAG: PhzF family phenazine biosynthesis protein [Acidobacteriaceae bacterium]
MSRTLTYSVLNVFAERPLEGNALAVFHDASTLSDEEMQALARETNLSETTFIFPDDAEAEARNGVRVRIFTTQEELPFAGHPTLGTATWLYLNRPALRGLESISLGLNVGQVLVSFEAQHAGTFGVIATMTQKDPEFGSAHDRAEVARVLGLKEEDLSAAHPPQIVSTGLPFCIVMLRSLEASQRLRLMPHEAQEWAMKHGASFLYCIAPLPAMAENGAAWHARMQFYGGEDPATGSAAGCCIAWMVKEGLVAADVPVVIEQGMEIGRPSRITVQAGMDAGRVHSVRVSGRTICVAEGRFFLP